MGGGRGQNESGGAKQVTGHFICTPNVWEPKMRSFFLFSHWNRKSKNHVPITISSFAFTPETIMSFDSFVPLA